MNILKEITNFYNGKIDNNKSNIINVTKNVVGEELSSLITNRVNTLMPIYIVTLDGLNQTRELELTSNEEKLIMLLYEVLGENENSYIGHYGYLKPSTLDLIKRRGSEFVMSYYEPKDTFAFHYTQDIYKGSHSRDLCYISHLLIYMGIKRHKNGFIMNTSNTKNELIERTYSYIISELSILILIELHKNKCYIFDNKSFIPSTNDFESSMSKIFIEFYKNFKDLIPMYLTNLDEFLKVVGESEFEDFSFALINNQVENIEEVMDSMLKNKNNYYGNIKLNTYLIESSIRKYKKNKRQN